MEIGPIASNREFHYILLILRGLPKLNPSPYPSSEGHMWHRLLCLPLVILISISVLAPVLPVRAEQQKQQDPLEKLFSMLTKYYVAVYRTGPQWTGTSEKQIEERMAIQANDIKKLVKSGKLVGFVQVTDSSYIKGVAFFKGGTQKEARAIVEKGKAVKDGLLKVEVYEIAGTHGLGAGAEKGPNNEKTTYYLTILSKGEIWTDQPGKDDGLMIDTHAANVIKLQESGTLRFYGAVIGTSLVRNISLVSGSSVEEVKTKLGAGPLIQKGWFTAEVYSCTIAEGTLP